MKNFKALLIAALAVVGFGFAACSSDDDPEPAVGITAVSVAPASSPIDYACAINGNQIVSDPVKMSTTEAELQQTVVKVTPTYNCTVECGGQTGTTTFTVDATQPVTLTVSGFGKSVTYTLTVVRATEPSTDEMELVSSSFAGFPANVISYDIAYFKDAFYATVTWLETGADKTIEHYDIYKSSTGTSWEKVDYTCTNPAEGKAGFGVGGEMAKMVVFKDKLYVMGGMHSKGEDIYGNPAEAAPDWFGGMSPTLNVFRCYSTSDGVSFTDETVGMTLQTSDGTERPITQMANTGMQLAELNGTLYMKAGYIVGFGMLQGSGSYYSTTDGKNWKMVTVDSSTGFNPNVHMSALFVYKGKIYRIGGFKSFIGGGKNDEIYQTENCETWTSVGTLPEAMQNTFGWTAVVGNDCVLVFGGQTGAESGSTAAMSTKVFRSTDCITWEEVTVPATYTGSRCAAGCNANNVAWVFGGYTNTDCSSYGIPTDASILGTETWVKRID